MKNIKHILYVDDDPDDHEIFQAAVAEVDPSVHVRLESDPSEALLYLKSSEQRPDIILIDINMPRMTGFDFCERMKLLKSVNTIPFMFYSTSNSQNEIARAEQLGAAGFITKSISYPELCDVVAFFTGKGNPDISKSIHIYDTAAHGK